MALRASDRDTAFRHVVRLTDDRGIYEHAEGVHPRFDHGYCTDDNARLLIVAVRHTDANADAGVLARVAARFLLDGQVDGGLMHNRLSFERMWTDVPSWHDHWGRTMWAFGSAVSLSNDTELRNRCYEAFEIGQDVRTPFLRSLCFSVLGAAEILATEPHHAGAIAIMHDAATRFSALPKGDRMWPWPERRLAYANALIPEAMIACGVAIENPTLVTRGLLLLQWLVKHETSGDHLSVVGTGGCGPADVGPFFDQQPIEVAAIADAAKRAFRVTGHEYWNQVVELSVGWFLGNNDSGESMIDLVSGGGFDGLQLLGVNTNQGAESTLAMLATMQHRSSTWLV